MQVLLGNPAYVRSELFAFEKFLKISEELLPTAKLLRYLKGDQEIEGLDPEEDGGDIPRESAIEAAEHVYPRYLRGANSYFHRLFDRQLLRLGADYVVRLDPKVEIEVLSDYDRQAIEQVADQPINFPRHKRFFPSRDLIRRRYERSSEMRSSAVADYSH
jgi:hypothetical protein